jgi:hypothetical protein
VQEQARAAGIAAVALSRAKPALGIRLRKAGMDGGWVWGLPDENDEERLRE